MAAPRPAPFLRRATTTEIHESLVELLYDAATDLDAWPAALDLLATCTRSTGAGILVRDRGSDDRPRLWKQRGPLPARTLLETGSHAWPHGPSDELRMLVIEGRPNPRLLGATLFVEARIEATLVLARGPEEAPYASEDLVLAGALTPHLRRAVTIALRMQRLARERDGLAEALDRIPIGALLVTREGRVVRANASARAIVTARDGLAIVGGVLGTQSAVDAPALRRMLRQASLPDEGLHTTPPSTLVHIRRASLRRAYCVTALSLASVDRTLAPDGPTALVLVSDPDGDVSGLTPIIRELYGLTPTEGQVATMLLQGTGVEAIAAAADVSLNTVRTHLKRTFSKMEVGSQSDLVRVLLAGPARIVPRATAADVSP